jgi:hypothetical protein
VQQEGRRELERVAASDSAYHRAWAQRRLQLAEEAAAGKTKLQYDVQTFHLERGDEPWHFVRAEWRALGETAFGASVWIKGGKALTIVDQDLTAALWLNMFEFHDGLSRDHYGLVLNVVDRDADGWAEVLFGRTGYEGGRVTLREASPTGFVDVVHYGFGC